MRRAAFGLVLALWVVPSAASAAPDAAAQWQLLTAQARGQDAAGHAREALVFAEQALRAAEAFPGQDPRLAQSCVLLAGFRVLEGDDVGALGLYQQALRIQETLAGETDPSLADLLEPLAQRELALGDIAKAEWHLQRAITLRRAVAPGQPTAATQLLLSRLSLARGESVPAEVAAMEALREQERTLGEHHPALAETLAWLAQVYAQRRDFAAAARMLERAAALLETEQPATNARLARVLILLANIYLMDGRPGQGIPVAQRALALRKAAFGGAHPAVADALVVQANIYLAAGADRQAQGAADHAVRLLVRALPKEDLRLADALRISAKLYDRRGRAADAEKMCRKALAIREQLLGQDHPQVAEALLQLSRVIAVTRRADAAALYQRAHAITAATGALTSDALPASATSGAPAAPAALAPAADTAAPAAVPPPAALRQRVTEIPSTAPHDKASKAPSGDMQSDVAALASSLQNRAEVYVRLGQPADAAMLYRQVIEAYRRVLPPEHPLVAAAQARYEALRRSVNDETVSGR